jgi:dTDP-4-dehydrorhamnose reductase
MRLLVTGASGLVGSNLAAAAAQQSWSVLGTWRDTPVSVLGARTAQLDVTDRHTCVALAEELEPDVVVHAAAESSPGRLEREPRLAELNVLGAENTLAAARAVRARYVLVSCDLVFSGLRPSGLCWDEEDPAEPAGALGRSLLGCERLAQRYQGSWLITRPADVYGLNLSIPAAASHPSAGSRGAGSGMPGSPRGERVGTAGGFGLPANGNGASWIGLSPALPAGPSRAATALARERHVWARSGLPLRWVEWLRAGRPLAAPAGIRRSPTYAWDYAQRVCELIAQECEGVYNTAGPTILGRLAHLRLLARAFECDLQLVQEGSPAAFLRACGEPPDVALPANTALCDDKASFVLGRPATDPFTGHRLMRRELERLLGWLGPAGTDPPGVPLHTETDAPLPQGPEGPLYPAPVPASSANGAPGGDPSQRALG